MINYLNKIKSANVDMSNDNYYNNSHLMFKGFIDNFKYNELVGS